METLRKGSCRKEGSGAFSRRRPRCEIPMVIEDSLRPCLGVAVHPITPPYAIILTNML